MQAGIEGDNLDFHVIARPEMPTPIRWFAQLWPSHSIQQIADVSSTYGRPLPWMTGKLRVPVFLQITMNGPENLNHRWDPWKDAQGYEKISEYNAAWRNLVVDMSLLAKEISSFAGKQKDPEPEASAQNNLDPEVEIRRVIIEELYHDAIENPTTKEHAVRTISHVITPAFVSLQIVLLQIGLCYGLIYLGLRRSTGTRQASH